ncbi:MAG: hypothetical protein LBE12_03245 [Planctomycetaceae bacterium]|jgi:hypothetical protein|nr:hypothetical protein [Planctomycetaceae bacterium]
MNKKITRRIALGMIIGGLAVAPFVVRSFRNSRKDISSNYAYGDINIPLDKIDSDLDLSKRKKALEIFVKERNRWLQFRGFEGKIDARTIFLSSNQEIMQNGFFTLTFDYKKFPEERFGGLSLANLNMKFSNSKHDSSIWSFTLDDRRSRKHSLTGSNVKGIEWENMFQLFVGLTTALPGCTNGHFVEMLPVMVVTEDSEQPNTNSFVFAPNSKLSSDGFQNPTLKFSQGLLSTTIPKRQPDTPYPVSQMSDYANSNGFMFPRKYSLSPVNNGGILTEEQNREFSVSVSECTVFHV